MSTRNVNGHKREAKFYAASNALHNPKQERRLPVIVPFAMAAVTWGLFLWMLIVAFTL